MLFGVHLLFVFSLEAKELNEVFYKAGDCQPKYPPDCCVSVSLGICAQYGDPV